MSSCGVVVGSYLGVSVAQLMFLLLNTYTVQLLGCLFVWAVCMFCFWCFQCCVFSVMGLVLLMASLCLWFCLLCAGCSTFVAAIHLCNLGVGCCICNVCILIVLQWLGLSYSTCGLLVGVHFGWRVGRTGTKVKMCAWFPLCTFGGCWLFAVLCVCLHSFAIILLIG